MIRPRSFTLKMQLVTRNIHGREVNNIKKRRYLSLERERERESPLIRLDPHSQNHTHCKHIHLYVLKERERDDDEKKTSNEEKTHMFIQAYIILKINDLSLT